MVKCLASHDAPETMSIMRMVRVNTRVRSRTGFILRKIIILIPNFVVYFQNIHLRQYLEDWSQAHVC